MFCIIGLNYNNDDNNDDNNNNDDDDNNNNDDDDAAREVCEKQILAKRCWEEEEGSMEPSWSDYKWIIQHQGERMNNLLGLKLRVCVPKAW